jgi:hypothetical protein
MAGQPFPLPGALEAFLNEHRRCWLAHGEGLTMGEDETTVCLYSGCGATLAINCRV